MNVARATAYRAITAMDSAHGANKAQAQSTILPNFLAFYSYMIFPVIAFALSRSPTYAVNHARLSGAGPIAP